MFKYQKLGLYIHIPFCFNKCPYCDFYSIKYPTQNNIIKQYFQALIYEIMSYKPKIKYKPIIVDSIYFGGGTPSIIDPENISNIIKTIKKVFELKNPEITLELNPYDIEKSYLSKLKKSSINRLSIGIQSANDDELFILGRSHTSEQAKEAVLKAKSVDFKNISVDIILGIPNQTIEKIKHSLDFINQLNINHVSAYLIQIEKNTLFDQQSIKDNLPNDDLIADIYLYVVESLEKMGFIQYEISNFAKPNYISKHNLKYWNLEEYIGFGPAAHSYFNKQRYYLVSNIYKYIKMGQNNKFVYLVEDKSYNQKDINEYIMLKLRLVEGINLNDMKKRYSEAQTNEFLCKVKQIYNKQYLDIKNNFIRLTKKGFLIYNVIVSDLLLD